MTGDVLYTEVPRDWILLTTRGRAVLEVHGRLTALLQNRGGPALAHLLAQPVFGARGEVCGWRSPWGGVLTTPGPGMRGALQAEADQLCARIAVFADELAQSGEAGALSAHLLRSGLVSPDGAGTLRADGARPVLINWGMAVPGQPVPLPPVPLVARRHRAVLALGGLAAVVAAALWVGWPADLAPGGAGVPMALSPLAGACRAAVAPGALCLPSAASARPREVVLVLDASASMGYPVTTPPALERAMLTAVGDEAYDRFADLQDEARALPGTQRMSLTRQAVSNVLRDLPRDASLALVSFHDCGDVRAAGRFRADDGTAFAAALDAIQPTNATDLARAIRAAPALISDDAEAAIVIVSDGLDSCGGDPCAAVRAVHEARPDLRVSVVDLSDFKALACVADASGGSYVARAGALDAAALAALIRGVILPPCTRPSG